MNKAIFIDKDGTLIDDVPYNVNPSLMRLQKGVIEGLTKLKAEGYLLIIISNQSGIAHGYFTEDDLDPVKNRLHEMLQNHDLEFDGFYFCPHHPNGKVEQYAVACSCRKPKPGMIFSAADHFNIELSASWMIGDILNDVEAGNKAGCRTILINNGNETEWILNESRRPTGLAGDLDEAAMFILKTHRYEKQTQLHL
jgi:D-glycero-D-manno-heptose 1,7-bisphosphate phosphatase